MMKKSEGIFISLVKKYVLFVLLVIFSIILTLVFTLYEINVSGEKGMVPKVSPSDIVKSDYKNIYVKDLEGINGWVEILDEDMKVIYTKGQKKDNFYKYSNEDIINLLNMDSKNKYLGIMQKFKSQDGKNLYCLAKYPSDAFKLQINLNKSSYKTGSIIYGNLIKGFLIFLLISIINITLFGKWTSKKIQTPLSEITLGIEKMAEGNLDARMDFKAEKEFAIIRDSFNNMAYKLKKSEEEKKELQKSRNNMLMDLSHDIKTPISTILCFSKALSEGLITEKEKKERYYHTIYSKGERVSGLINDLFEFVKMESTDYSISKTKADFCEFIREITAEFYDEMEEKNYDLDIRIPEKEIIISFDERIMNRAISNLICNAIKYNPEGTKLRIEVLETEDKVILEIGDNGLGIPSHIKDTIFEPFVRGDKARKSDGGSGLGLAIAKKIIEKHNGALELKTNLKDEKTTFSITMPKN